VPEEHCDASFEAEIEDSADLLSLDNDTHLIHENDVLIASESHADIVLEAEADAMTAPQATEAEVICEAPVSSEVAEDSSSVIEVNQCVYVSCLWLFSSSCSSEIAFKICDIVL
jgi:hypothetical protein